MTRIVPSDTAIIAIADGAPPIKPNPVNALGAPLHRHLQTSLKKALDNPNIRAIILIGRHDGKGVFSAGSDIKEFSGSGVGTGVTISEPGETPTLNDIVHFMERSSKPIVAALTET